MVFLLFYMVYVIYSLISVTFGAYQMLKLTINKKINTIVIA